MIKILRTLTLVGLVVISAAVIIEIFPSSTRNSLPQLCDTDPSSPVADSYNPTPINDGFKEYWLKVDVNPFPEDATIWYRGKEVAYKQIYVVAGRAIDWGIDVSHPHDYGDDAVIFGIGTLWAWTPGHWAWQNADNWEIVVPCP